MRTSGASSTRTGTHRRLTGFDYVAFWVPSCPQRVVVGEPPRETYLKSLLLRRPTEGNCLLSCRHLHCCFIGSPGVPGQLGETSTDRECEAGWLRGVPVQLRQKESTGLHPLVHHWHGHVSATKGPNRAPQHLLTLGRGTRGVRRESIDHLCHHRHPEVEPRHSWTVQGVAVSSWTTGAPPNPRPKDRGRIRRDESDCG